MGLFTKKKLLKGGAWATFTFVVWELVESAFEYLIAFFITNAFVFFLFKTLTAIAIIKTTEIASIPIQKGLIVFLTKIFYVKGEQKVNNFKNILSKVWTAICDNKCSVGVIIAAVMSFLSGTSVINVNELPSIDIALGKPTPAIVQETDVIATEIVYGKEAVLATETIYGDPIFATEVIWEKEPVIADKVIYEEGKEPIYATETIYSVEPVIADKLTFIANTTIYEEDGETIKYNVGDIVLNSEVTAYTDKVDIFQVGDVIKEGTILFEKGSVIKEGVVKFNIGDVVEEGIVKHDIGDYIGNEILFNIGDVLEPAEILFNIGDVVIPAGTIIQEEIPAKTFNITPVIYWALVVAIGTVCGVYFETHKQATKRKEETLKAKQEKQNIKIAKKEVQQEQKSLIAEQKQKVEDAEKVKAEAERRCEIEQIKADIKAGKI